MSTTKVLKFSSENQSRKLVLGIVGIVSMFMFGLAMTASAATLYRQLELGMSGSDVSDLQIFLAKDATIYPQGLVTGYFGNLTKAAVSNFQARNGIAVVGRVGPITMAAINAQMGNPVGADIYGPTLNSLNISMTNSSATFNWNTNENASAIIYYSTSPLSMIEASQGTSVTIGGSSFLANTNLTSSHSGTLTGLQANTDYYYVIYVKDALGNETVTWPAIFHTSS